MPTEEDRKFDHYEICLNADGKPHVLGRGGMGITYLAEDTNLKTKVALKVIAPSALESEESRQLFLREARSAATLSHRNVAAVYHLGQRDWQVYYAMEYIDGRSVAQVLKQVGCLPVLDALDVALQVAQALSGAEKYGMIHRDIKPGNIMVAKEDDGRTVVKLIDFGLAKVALGGEDPTFVSQAGFLGTVAFASPEQLHDEDLDVRSDLYGLGVTLWNMLAGRVPWKGSQVAVMQGHMQGALPFDQLSDPPEGLVEVLESLLAKKRDDRPQSAAAACRLISDCMLEIENNTRIGSQTADQADPERTEVSLGMGTSLPFSGSVPRSAASGRSRATRPTRTRPDTRARWPWVVGGVLALPVLGGLAMLAFRPPAPGPEPGPEPVPGPGPIVQTETNQVPAAPVTNVVEVVPNLPPVPPPPPPPNPSEWMERARQATAGGQPQVAWSNLQHVVSAFPEAPEAQQARERLRDLVSDHHADLFERPSDLDPWRETFRAAAQEGDENAMGIVTRWTEPAEHGAWLLQLARGRRDAGEFGPALERFLQATAIEASRGDATDDLDILVESFATGGRELSDEAFSALRPRLEEVARLPLAIAAQFLADRLRVLEPAAAVGWYKQLAEADDAEAMIQLGLMHGSGLGIATNTQVALEWFEKAVALGDPQAQFILGNALLYSPNIPRDPSRAVGLLEKAVAQNHAEAMDLLAECARKGWGMETDPARALSLWQEAANLGFARAYANLAVMHMNGEGTPQDSEAAVRYITQGVEKGDGLALFLYGDVLESGLSGADPNPEKAREYRIRAARKNVMQAIQWCRENGVSPEEVQAPE